MMNFGAVGYFGYYRKEIKNRTHNSAYSLWRVSPALRTYSLDRDYPGMKDLSSGTATSLMLKTFCFSKRNILLGMKIREGNISDLTSVKELGQDTWKQFEKDLSSDNWGKLSNILSSENLYKNLLQNSRSFVCENEKGEIIGMSFLVASGNPTEIFSAEQCYIRFVTVSEKYKGLKLGQKLTEACIDFAKKEGEQRIALHTSEFMDKARHIYEKLGFEIIAEIEPRFGKRYWLYEMKL